MMTYEETGMQVRETEAGFEVSKRGVMIRRCKTFTTTMKFLKTQLRSIVGPGAAASYWAEVVINNSIRE